MPFDTNSSLWNGPVECHFAGRRIQPLEQSGPHCVSTVLAMLSGAEPTDFQGLVNTQDPVSWSRALEPYGLKLAYCPSDIRRVRYYLPELEALNDLFTVSYYLPTEPSAILGDPRQSDGWVCGSHIVIVHGRDILDPARGDRIPATQHGFLEHFTKRIFRVLPAVHTRGL